MVKLNCLIKTAIMQPGLIRNSHGAVGDPNPHV